jgi:predicted RNA binding protein YcfA (HicA-like mRNA interferase family)
LGKRRILSGNEVCKILEGQGFIEVRRRGSHVVMQKRADNTTITVPVPQHDELKPGTLSSIIRQSGLPKTLFET